MAERVLGQPGSARRRRFLGIPILIVALLSLFWIAGAQAVHDDTYFELDKDATNDLRTVALDTLNSNISATATSIVVCRKQAGDPPATIPTPATPFTILIDAEQMSVTAVASAKGGGCSTAKNTYTVTRAQGGTTAAAHSGGADVTQLIFGSFDGDDWDQVLAEVSEDANDEGTDDRCNDLGADECAFIKDPQEPTDTSIFTTGGSKDDLDVPNWQWTQGSVPDADEILNAYAIKYSTGGDQILYFGADRYATNGSKDFGFWFFREPVKRVGTTAGTFTGQHTAPTNGDDGLPNTPDDTPGDILILGTFTQGGATTNIRVFEWVGTGGNATANGTVAGPVAAFGDCFPGAANDNGCGTVNNTSVPLPSGWEYQAKDAAVGGYIPSGGFVEGGIDLTDLGLEGCFSSFVAETRSSPSVDAQLKDFVLGQFEACGSTTTTTPKEVSGAVGSETYSNIPADGVSIGTDGSVRVADEASVVVNGTQTYGGSVSFRLCGPTPLSDAAYTLCTASTGVAIEP